MSAIAPVKPEASIVDGYGLAIPSVPEDGIEIRSKLEKEVAPNPWVRMKRNANALINPEILALLLLISLFLSRTIFSFRFRCHEGAGSLSQSTFLKASEMPLL
jgi:hypothetical protein